LDFNRHERYEATAQPTSRANLLQPTTADLDETDLDEVRLYALSTQLRRP